MYIFYVNNNCVIIIICLIPIKYLQKKTQESCQEFEQLVIAQFEALIHCINGRREYLLDAIRMDRDNKIRILKVMNITIYIFFLNNRHKH